MKNPGDKPTLIPAVPVQPSAPKLQNKPRSSPQGRYPNNRRSGHSQNRNSGNSGRQHQRRNQASDQYNKYINLAKEAASSGDDITAETNYQHAEHYHRIMNPEPTV